jgi:hypothetical protein
MEVLGTSTLEEEGGENEGKYLWAGRDEQPLEGRIVTCYITSIAAQRLQWELILPRQRLRGNCFVIKLAI